jgi:ABC-type nitrate/sulfonate/bicarbonate transport system permease component
MSVLSAERATIEARVVAPDQTGSPWPAIVAKGLVVALGRAVLTLAVVLGLWMLFLDLFHVSSFVGKTPLDIWRYLFDGPQSSSRIHQLIQPSEITLRDASLGLAAGTLAAVGASLSFVLWRAAASMVLPFAMVLRSVPLVAMTPLIVGLFGRNLKAITIIAGVVTFFPTLVNVSLALQRTPKESLDLCRAYGASPATTLWKVQIPSSLPSLFASMRIAAPLALTGALLAEWLATGKGLGYLIITSESVSEYDLLWAGVVLVTLYSTILYSLIGLVERLVMRRFGAIDA